MDTTPKDPKDAGAKEPGAGHVQEPGAGHVLTPESFSLTFSGATMGRTADLRTALQQAAAEGRKANTALELLSRLVLDSHGPAKVRSEYSDLVDAGNYIRALLNDLSAIETYCKDVAKTASDAKKVMQSLRFGGRLLYGDLLEETDREQDRRANKQQELFNEDGDDDLEDDDKDDDEKRAEDIAQAMAAREKAERERDRRLDDAPFLATEPVIVIKESEMTPGETKPAKPKGRGRGRGRGGRK